MNFGAYIDNDALVITYMGCAILKDITLTPNMTNRGRIGLVPDRVLCEKERIAVEFRREAEDGRQLLSFKENPERFPMGLKAFIADVKQKYGIPHVGVWQAFTGYWKGVAEDSEIAREPMTALPPPACGRWMLRKYNRIAIFI